MSIARTLKQVGALYTQNLAAHGISSPSVGWKDETSQRLRFQKLAEVIEPTALVEGYSALDWGCGYGAMQDYLAERGGLRQFVGYDISAPMLAEAARRAQAHSCESLFRESSDVVDRADFVFVSGTFNVRFDCPPDEWREYIERTLALLWQHTRKGLAFNLLTTYVDWEAKDLYYADPAHFFDYCKRTLSPAVTLLHDYPLYEWTMLVRKTT